MDLFVPMRTLAPLVETALPFHRQVVSRQLGEDEKPAPKRAGGRAGQISESKALVTV
jgi:hypothetical protein